MSCFYDNKWPSHNFYHMHVREIQAVGVRGSHPLITMNLKRALELLITNPMSLLRSSYDHALYTYLTCPQGTTYNPCPEGCGVVISNIVSEPFNYVEQNGYLKILIGCVWGKGGHGKRGWLPSYQF